MTSIIGLPNCRFSLFYISEKLHLDVILDIFKSSQHIIILMQFLSRCFLLRAAPSSLLLNICCYALRPISSAHSSWLAAVFLASLAAGLFIGLPLYYTTVLAKIGTFAKRIRRSSKRRSSISDNSTLQHVGIISLTLMEIFCIRFIFLGWAKMHLTNDIPTHRLYGQFDTIFWHRIQYYCRYPSNPGSGTFYGLFTTKHNSLFWKILLVEKRDKIMYIKA